MPEADNKDHTGLAIIAGGGAMPVTVAEAAAAQGRAVHIFGIEGAADASIERFPHSWVNFGEVGRILRVAKESGCAQLVIVGGVRRPALKDVRFDLGAIANLPAMLALTIGGDNSVLSRVVDFFESKGLQVKGAHEIATELVAGEGALGRHRPGRTNRDDIAVGLRVIAALGSHDVGQAVVVARRHVLAVEAAEGTDAMLERCRALTSWTDLAAGKRAGVLVKCAKPGQERRVDLPAVGPETVRRVDEAGLAGIAIAAGEVLIAERQRFIAAADAAGLFVQGVKGLGGEGT